jgi:hypothetical protein
MCNLTKDLNWYDLYRPKYGEGLSVADRTRKSSINGKEFEYVAGRTFREYTPFLKHMIGSAKDGEKEYTMLKKLFMLKISPDHGINALLTILLPMANHGLITFNQKHPCGSIQL